MSRRTCEGCGRPETVCLCAALRSIPVQTKVVVVQHPREADNAIGTAWMVERCFGALRIIGVDLADNRALNEALSNPLAPPIVLSPGENARDLDREPPTGPVTLVLIDGTWSQAKQLLARNPQLASLPRYAFAPATPSNYRIRREPSDHCVSTVEAAVTALTVLESTRGNPVDVRAALAPFEAMVNRQIQIAKERRDNRHLRAAIARAAERPNHAPRRRSLTGRNVVVIHGEANCWPRGHELGPFPELVHVVGERISSGDRFESFLVNDLPLSPAVTKHMQLPLDRIAAGRTRADFRVKLAEFLRPDDEIFVWGSYLHRLIVSELHDGAITHACFDLRRHVAERLGHAVGDAASLARAWGVEVAPAWAAGRTGARLAASVAVARSMSDGALAAELDKHLARWPRPMETALERASNPQDFAAVE